MTKHFTQEAVWDCESHVVTLTALRYKVRWTVTPKGPVASTEVTDPWQAASYGSRNSRQHARLGRSQHAVDSLPEPLCSSFIPSSYVQRTKCIIHLCTVTFLTRVVSQTIMGAATYEP